MRVVEGDVMMRLNREQEKTFIRISIFKIGIGGASLLFSLASELTVGSHLTGSYR
jgi:hypothetical protein